MDGVTIIDSSAWSNVLSIIWQGLRFLDSIVLFDVRDVHLTFLGFDIAVLAFSIVWNTCGLWSYDFDQAYYDDGSSDFDDGDGGGSSPPFTGYRHFNEEGDDYSELDIIPDEDDDAL